ncbi:hypothetical protein [Sodalis-like endosymbiont of Proechinophthirus fluctus]|uniref:hypothetical protein n=1 Tax=Sodalis-like endosymbiont of Proechinophthirus fluctus TaxID=1462730 RepID=UPI0019590E96|nr:hypothetical protein [Sodalis-like endosymbiont of Proechinophthirus fluctus]
MLTHFGKRHRRLCEAGIDVVVNFTSGRPYLGKIIGLLTYQPDNDPMLADCVNFDNPRTYTLSDIATIFTL